MKPFILGAVFARGGSKGVPHKNIRLLCGKPLIAYAIEAARAVKGIDDVIVSTDDEQIAEVARQYGASVPFMRPAELATDSAAEILAWKHAVKEYERVTGKAVDVLVSVPATAPLREPVDVEKCLECLLSTDTDVVLSVAEPHRNPYFNMVKLDVHGNARVVMDGSGVTRRQDAPAVFDITTVAYAVRRPFLLSCESLWDGKVKTIEVPRERSLDIDTLVDLELAEFFFMRGKHRKACLKDDGGRALSLWDKIMAGPQVFVIAEAGVNHNGDIELAKKLVDAAASAGADAVKFQTFRTDKLVTATAPKAGYQKLNDSTGDGQAGMLKRLELSFQQFAQLKSHCDAKGILFLSTPFDNESADFLFELGMPFFKVSSGDLTNMPLLERIARKGLPVILSTGMSDLDEIAEAVALLKKNGCQQILLLQCVSNYPAHYRDVNLLAMKTLSERFGLPAGLSDHTLGIEASIAAVAIGARVIEKHFTLDKASPGPDHKASLDPLELRSMISAIRNVTEALGDGVKRVAACEDDPRRVSRRSLIAARDIRAGEMLKAGDVCFKRPGTGMPPAALSKVLGKRAVTGIPADTVIMLEMLA